MSVDWMTFGASIGGAVLGSGLVGSILNYKHSRDIRKDSIATALTSQMWLTFEKEIELYDKSGDSEQANLLRREYAQQLQAWRAQQNVSARPHEEINAEPQTTLSEDELEQLRQLLSSASRLEPSLLSAEDLSSRADAYYRTGRYQEALADYSKSLELRPDHPAIFNNRGNTLRRLGRYEDALADYNKSLELRPDHPGTLMNRGIALDDLGRSQEALADYNRSLELHPDDPTTLTNRGLALHHLGHHEQALNDYNRSLELRPDNPTTTYNIACNSSLRGSFQESLEWLAKAISLDSKYREMAQYDGDFASLKATPEFGPRFQQLITGSPESEPKN